MLPSPSLELSQFIQASWITFSCEKYESCPLQWHFHTTRFWHIPTQNCFGCDNSVMREHYACRTWPAHPRLTRSYRPRLRQRTSRRVFLKSSERGCPRMIDPKFHLPLERPFLIGLLQPLPLLHLWLSFLSSFPPPKPASPQWYIRRVC